MEFPNVVDLNVGGRHFTTSLTTLTKYPGSRLAAMFSGTQRPPQDDHGRYFIDVDGDVFEHILNFLRFEKLPPKEKALDVYEYANQFGIGELSIRQLEWGPVLADLLQTKGKNTVHGYDSYLQQVRNGLIGLSFDNGYFYIQLSDTCRHVFWLCEVDEIQDGHQVINVDFRSSTVKRSTLLNFLLKDLKDLNILPDGDGEVVFFTPSSKCNCRIAIRFIMILR